MKTIYGIILGLSMVGCAPKEPFVRLAKESLPKAVAISVVGVMEQTVLVMDENGFTVKQETVPVVIRGSGVLVSPNNHILTCNHLFGIQDIKSITVCTNDGTCTAADILAQEDKLDLALLQGFFDTPTPYVRIADPRELRVGQEVMAIGSPLGLTFSVSHGIISALNRDEIGVYNMTQSDAFINPGNSGGPLFNLRGELVGINSRILPPVDAPVFTGLGFSVQSGQIIEFLTRTRNKYLGLPKISARYWDGFLTALNLK